MNIPTGDGPLDLTALREVFDDDSVALGDFIDIAVSEIEDALSRLAVAIAKRDVTLAASIAHAGKGAAGTIGARSIADPLRRIEEAVRTGAWAQADVDIGTAETARADIGRWRAGLDNSRSDRHAN